MAYITENQLRDYAARPRYDAFSNIKTASRLANLTIFLSHSHKDKNLVEGLIVYFETLGITIYVDWNDTQMPASQIVQRLSALRRTFEISIFL